MSNGAAKIGYAAMLEQFGPREVTEYSVAAEKAGFSGVMAADHFQPWVPEQGSAPFVWNVMTLIAEQTKGDIGPGVTCPGWRMHPATVAQASATLAAMYPNRHWLGLGSGEALNEHVVGGYWPEVGERIARMFEAIEIIRKLFTGKEVKHAGRWYQLESTRLWTLPDAPPPIYVATAGPITARKTGELTRRSRPYLRSLPRVHGAPARIPQRCRRSSNSTFRGRQPTRRRWPTHCASGQTAE